MVPAIARAHDLRIVGSIRLYICVHAKIKARVCKEVVFTPSMRRILRARLVFGGGSIEMVEADALNYLISFFFQFMDISFLQEIDIIGLTISKRLL
ncbi:hypothetical protein GOP47_0000882 [Adiantum capillus-veneris]|uniref:Uncharacterized protein n=1 Tax=Adiantum capillus-veneris TaxID=13818 RepID=A0A9D4ZR49_ADICA|nr:hypothetical protein GOP47_0000882 [Adiantum capillus-veneris]